MLFTAPAMAQVLPGAVQPGRDRPQPAAPVQPDFDFSIVAPHRSPVPRAVDEVHFKLADLKITGTSSIPAATFRPLYAPLIGKDVTLGDILDVADKIEAVYRQRGYLLVRAYVPPQRVRDGIFTINIVEGHLGTVAVQGGNRETKRLIRGYMRPAVMARPLTLPAMERGLLLTNDLPGVTATGVLKASPDTPGASDLIVDVQQPFMTGGVAVDNRGSRYSGLWTLAGDVEFNGLLGADQLQATFTTSPDALEQIAGSLRYRTAIGDDGLIGSLIGTVTHGEPGSTLSGLVATDSWLAGARLTYPLLRTRRETLLLDFGLTAQDARVDLTTITPHSHDQWRVVDLGASYQRAGLFGGGVWTVTADLAQGLPILGATPDGDLHLSRVGGTTSFTKLTGYTRLLLPLGDNFSTALAAQGQYSPDRLITGEQIAFGGTQIGRGYDPGAITGDDGFGASAELRYDFRFANSFIQGIQPYVYVDGAQTWYKPDPSLKDQTITSVGGGLRFWLSYNITGAIEGAQTLRKVPGSDNNQTSTKILLDLSVRF